MIPAKTLARIPPEIAAELAEFFASISAQLQGHASEAARKQQQRAALLHHKTAAMQAARRVDQAAAGGVPLAAALELVSLESGIDPDGIRTALTLVRRKMQTDRAREIMQLRRRGWSNKEIGQRVGLHPSTVGRIIAKELKG